MHSLNRDNAQTLTDPAQRSGAGCWLPRAAPSKELGSPVRPHTASARARCKTVERLLPFLPRSLKQPAPPISFRKQERVLTWVCPSQLEARLELSGSQGGGMPVQSQESPLGPQLWLGPAAARSCPSTLDGGGRGLLSCTPPRPPHAVCSLRSQPPPCSTRACFPAVAQSHPHAGAPSSALSLRAHVDTCPMYQKPPVLTAPPSGCCHCRPTVQGGE